MRSSISQLLAIACLLLQAFAYVDFGTVTGPASFVPTFTVARPHQLPDDVYMRYASHYSHITAIAPSITLLGNGTPETFWSMHYHHNPSRTKQGKGLFRRGVFSGDSATATCTPCGNTGSSSNTTTQGSRSCSVTEYTGVFRSGGVVISSTTDYCFSPGYTGPLQYGASTTSAGLPCCAVCYSANANATGSFITGVFSTTPTIHSGGNTRPTNSYGRSTTPTISPGGSTNTVIVTATATTPVTSTLSTLSVITVLPNVTTTGSPTVSTSLNTIIGCGTASDGCGTVIGNGTVYLAPFGYPAVTSTGTVSGCAPTVIGCGTMLATTGIFTGSATLTACGEGTGTATMIGSGTVWPAGFMDMISFVSSGTVTGTGRVKGCGILTGSGTFTISEPYTTTVTPSATPTVNIYISYCPPDPLKQNQLLRIASNLTSTSPANGGIDGNGSASYPDLSAQNRYTQDALLNVNGSSNYTQLNTTNSNSTLTNPLCHICPQDSGICCPLFTDCGADGHCPWTALEACGYARFGVNLVDMRNSSSSLGMEELPVGVGYGVGNARLRAPGLPGSTGGTGSEDVVGRSLSGKGALHEHVRRHARGAHGFGH